MNFWQVQAAARRKNRARNDILGLLENRNRRKRTSKKTQSVVRKQFGLFAKTESFTVRLADDNENGPIAASIDRSKTTARRRNKGRKSGTSAKSRMQAFDVVDLVEDTHTSVQRVYPYQQQQQIVEHSVVAANHREQTITSQSAPHPIVERTKEMSANRHTQSRQDETDRVDLSRISVGFTLGTLDVTAELHSPKSPQKPADSIDFNALDNHSGANADENPSAIRLCNFQSAFGRLASKNGSSLNNSVSGDTNQSRWSLEMPSFSDDRNSNWSVRTSFQVDERLQTQNSTGTTLASNSGKIHANGPTGFVPEATVYKQRHFSTSRYDQCHHSKQSNFRRDANTEHDFFNFGQTTSDAELSSINSRDEYTLINHFEAPNKTKPFTLDMVIGRKSLGARHANERIFGGKDNHQDHTSNSMTNANRNLQQQANDANRPPMPEKSSMPSSFSYQNAFRS